MDNYIGIDVLKAIVESADVEEINDEMLKELTNGKGDDE